MPFSYTIHRDPDLHHIRFVGHATVDDTRQLFTVAMKDPAHVPGMPALVDFSVMTGTDAGFLEMMSIRDSLEQVYAGRPRPIRISMLAQSGATFGMARMFQTLVCEIEGVEVEIFSDLAPALELHDLTGTPTGEHIAADIASHAVALQA